MYVMFKPRLPGLCLATGQPARYLNHSSAFCFFLSSFDLFSRSTFSKNSFRDLNH